MNLLDMLHYMLKECAVIVYLIQKKYLKYTVKPCSLNYIHLTLSYY